MVRTSTFGMCVLLTLLVSGQEIYAATPVPGLLLKRERAHTDAQGLRCIVGSALSITGGKQGPGAFVEVPETGVLPQGLYLGALAVTTRGLRLVISRSLTQTELATTYEEVRVLTAAQMDDLIRRAITAPLVVDRPVKTEQEPQIGIGDPNPQGCEVFNSDEDKRVRSRYPIGWFSKIAIAIEGEVPAPQPDHSATKPAAVEQADPRERVVNVRNPKGQSIGAGVVIGKTANRLYIITARHVVWSDDGKVPGVTVSFFSLAGESFPVTVLDFSDDTLDLAVLSIPTATAGLPEVAKLVVGNPRELVLGATVRSIGHPGGVLWKMAATPEKFSRRVSSDLEFESLIADGGSSGGGLFNSCGALIGITKKAGMSIGVASPIDRVLDRLAEWNIEITSTTLACDSK